MDTRYSLIGIMLGFCHCAPASQQTNRATTMIPTDASVDVERVEDSGNPAADTADASVLLPAALQRISEANTSVAGLRLAWVGSATAKIRRSDQGVTSPDAGTTLLEVTEESEGAVRAIASCNSLFYQVWLNIEGLLQVPGERTTLSPTPRVVASNVTTAPTSSIRVAPGILLTLGRHEQQMVEVRYDEDGVQFSGWLPESSLRRVFSVETLEPPSNAGLAVIDGSFDLLSQARGRRLASITLTPSSGSSEVLAIGNARAGFQLVQFPVENEPSVIIVDRWLHYIPTGAFQIRGFIQSSRVRAVAPGGSGRGFGHLGYGPPTGTTAVVPERTVVYDVRNGEPIGISVGNHRYAVSPVSEGGYRVTLCSPWGELFGWVNSVVDLRTSAPVLTTPTTHAPSTSFN